MTVPLDKPIKRQVEIDGKAYTLTLGPDSVTIVRKGARKGPCVTWASLLEGTPQLRHALAKSIEAVAADKPKRERAPARKR